MGINWVYAGIKYEPNYNQTGLSTMLIGGGFIDSWGDLQLVGTLSTSYQYRFGKSPIFFNLGISTALRMDTWDGSIYWLVGPVISLKGHF